MIIRRANENDIEKLLVLSESFYQVAGYKDIIPFCKESSREYVLISLDMGLISVAEHKGEVVGFVLGLAIPFIMNKEYLVGTELAWWMEPEHRKGSAGIKLLAHIEKSAKEMGCRMWSMMSLEGLEPEKIEKLYLSRGYKKTENTFTKEF